MGHSKGFIKAMRIYGKEHAKLVGPKDTINYKNIKNIELIIC